jgi:hypothetical protein
MGVIYDVLTGILLNCFKFKNSEVFKVLVLNGVVIDYVITSKERIILKVASGDAVHRILANDDVSEEKAKGLVGKSIKVEGESPDPIFMFSNNGK